MDKPRRISTSYMGRNGSTENVGDQKKKRKSCQQVGAGEENFEKEGEWGKKKRYVLKKMHIKSERRIGEKYNRNSEGVPEKELAGLR